MNGRIADFLNRMSNAPVENLPLVHTTPAYNLQRIFRDQIIRTSPCEFFNQEQLCYFFFGRPAYKWETESEACDWELPVCFVFEYDLSDIVRAFPFDTGAFFSKRLPHFLTMMPIEEFEISSIPDGPSKLVSAYFHSVSDYYSLNCRSEDAFRDYFTVNDIESEVRALHKLYAESRAHADDRRAAVELQFKTDFSLRDRTLLALIMPDIYLSDKNIVEYAKDNKVSLITYDVFPLNSAAYTATIYQKLRDFYRRRRYIKK